MAKKSFWNTPSKYGTYEGERGSPEQWAANFNVSFENSESIQKILGMSAYQVLNIQPHCSDEDVKTAYRKFARLYHPDKGGDAELFQKYTTAYETIKKLRNMEIIPVTNTIRTHTRSTATASTQSQSSTVQQSELIIPQLLTPIDESEIESYLTNDEFGGQEKKDGKHLTLQIINNELVVRNKKGDISNCAPEFESSLRLVGHDILIDGEQIGDKFWAWDILEFDGLDLRGWTYISRYTKLSSLFFGPSIKILKLYTGTEAKRKLFADLKANGKEGIVFKKITSVFSPGKGLDQLKFKFYAECSVIVTTGRQGRSSIGMELINSQGQREFVGYCSCNRNPPLGSIAEIKYLYAYRGGCLYQPAFKELRDDVDVSECTTSQLKYKSEENDED